MITDQATVIQFIENLPKTETHLHLEGALPWDLLVEKNPERFSDQPAFRSENFRYSSFEEFESILIDHALAFFHSSEDYYLASQKIFELHLSQNVKYVEISFHAGMIEFLGIPGKEILAAIKAAVPDSLEVRIFLGMSRNAYTQYLGPKLEDAIENWDDLAGIDLHGLETIPIQSWTKPFWERASKNGKVLKAHAGEFGPAENVLYAIKELKVRRIQHGVHASNDLDLLRLAREENVVFDLCPISNYKLKVIEKWEDHPLPNYLKEGLVCTLSTDDPLSFNNTLNQEYLVCHKELGLDIKNLSKLARNGFEIADLPSSEKTKWQDEIRSVERNVKNE